jgi:uncharacterized protein YceK
MALILMGFIISGCGAIGHELTHITKSEHPRYLGSAIDLEIATALFTKKECYTDFNQFSLCAVGPLVLIDLPFTFFIESIRLSDDRHTSYIFSVKN